MKIGFLNFLTIVFVVAKIAGFIDWSWLLVFAPTFLAVFCWILTFVLFLIAEWVD